MTKNEEFIEKAKKIHGDKYDYSKVEYVKANIKVCIICPEHGEFWQTPNNHLSGKGCHKCGINKQALSHKKNKELFLKEANNVHGSKYDYSKYEYINSHVKSCIICPEHGEFWQSPLKHISGCGCPKCANNVKYTTEEFISKAKAIYGEKYDYSKVKYINRNTKVCIIDKENGEFWQLPFNHLNGYGPNCVKGTKVWQKRNKMTTEEFIKRANEVHNNKYDYSKTKYTNGHAKVCIICPKHGEFLQAASNHLNGQGCPKCKRSKLEESVEIELIKSGIKYIHSASKKDFSWLGRQSLDFFLPDYNVAIECQGIQHYEAVEQYGGKERLEEQIKNDTKKLKLCQENGVKILYYTQYKIDGVNIAKTKKELINKIKHGF